MFRQDADDRAPARGDARERNSYIPPPLPETDSTCQTPLSKNLLNKDLLGFMSRFFVKRFPS